MNSRISPSAVFVLLALACGRGPSAIETVQAKLKCGLAKANVRAVAATAGLSVFENRSENGIGPGMTISDGRRLNLELYFQAGTVSSYRRIRKFGLTGVETGNRIYLCVKH